MIYIWIITLFFTNVISSPFGPVYPITAAFFKDRFSIENWNDTLNKFKTQGGDTVVLRAPALLVRTKENLDSDPDYTACGSNNSGGVIGTSCYEVATQDLISKGLNVSAVVTYSYEEDYGSTILSCPEYDKILPSSSNKKYHRIVLPATKLSADCKYSNGSTVVVLLTMFSGVDPHVLLLQSAKTRNISIILGIPGKPEETAVSVINLIPAYINWIERVLKDHDTRYSMSTLYNTVYGYISRDEIMLSDVDSRLFQFYKTISDLVHVSKKKFIVTANIDLTRFTNNRTVTEHIEGFANISNLSANIDVISVHEGRGYGKAGLFWPTQLNQPINESDTKLLQILQRLHPMIKPNTTYNEVFTGSVQALFLGLQSYKTLHKNTPELWLLLEAEENLQDEPCRPVDTKGSGNAELMDRTSKSRIDHSLTAAGSTVQKVLSFAYDPDFTCTTKSYSVPLTDEISHDSDRPIISNCSFHSPSNRSVVLIGYNLEGETQGFMVDWPDRDGKRHNDEVHGYYFEIDYGQQHGLVPSLEYTQLYDPYDVISLADHGYVKVKAEGGYHGCEFVFDFRGY